MGPDLDFNIKLHGKNNPTFNTWMYIQKGT
jgi:hypothetical protein